MTPEGAARVEAERVMATVFDGHETRPLMERCVVWTHEGPPLLPPAYNDIHQIFQTGDNFVLFTELATNPPRIFPLDGRPDIPDAIRQFGGHSRARWEGDTLVVETDHFIARRNYRGANQFRHVEERFTRIAEDEIRYEFTITDPTTWTSPWSGVVPMIRTEGPMFEYACHEGNHDIRHILEINRNLELPRTAGGRGGGRRGLEVGAPRKARTMAPDARAPYSYRHQRVELPGRRRNLGRDLLSAAGAPSPAAGIR